MLKIQMVDPDHAGVFCYMQDTFVPLCVCVAASHTATSAFIKRTRLIVRNVQVKDSEMVFCTGTIVVQRQCVLRGNRFTEVHCTFLPAAVCLFGQKILPSQTRKLPLKTPNSPECGSKKVLM